jgi:hypothetical protein
MPEGAPAGPVYRRAYALTRETKRARERAAFIGRRI